MNKRDGNPSSEHILAMITNLMMMIDWYGIGELGSTCFESNRGGYQWFEKIASSLRKFNLRAHKLPRRLISSTFILISWTKTWVEQGTKTFNSSLKKTSMATTKVTYWTSPDWKKTWSQPSLILLQTKFACSQSLRTRRPLLPPILCHTGEWYLSLSRSLPPSLPPLSHESL